MAGDKVRAGPWAVAVLLLMMAATSAGAETAPAAPAAPAASAAPGAAALVPLQAFFQPPAMSQAGLSPSGRHLAWLERLPGGRVGLKVIDLDSQDPPLTYQASATDDFAWLTWADDDWLLFSLRDTEVRKFLPPRGPGLMAMRRDGGAQRVVVARGARDMPPDAYPPGAWLMALGPPGSRELVLGRAHYGTGGVYQSTTLSLVNFDTLKGRAYFREAPKASHWWFDALGRPRIIEQVEADQVRLLWRPAREAEPGRWQELARWHWLQAGWSPAWVGDDDDLHVQVHDERGHAEVRLFDFENRRPAARALMGTPGFSGPINARRGGRDGPVIGVDVALEAQEIVWFTPEMKALQAQVDARLPGRVNRIDCGRCQAPRHVLVHSMSDADAGRWLLFSPGANTWRQVGLERPEIDPRRMGRTELLRIRARDGLELPVWVTRPAQPGSDGPPPGVMLVHGGPLERGAMWTFNAEAQFLASRGYVVLQPEFRGSLGYGDGHFRAGFKQYGGAMIDDITDALRHAAARGWVDPGRTCIMGASYGGYAALMSLVKEPALYRCGIAHAAVSDLRHQFEFFWSDISWMTRRDVLPHLVGDPKQDAAMFVATSPVEQVARIQAPVLLMHGDEDRRVPIENGERMRDALKKAGKAFEWVVYEGEGHGFSRPQNLEDHYRRVEAFLARHLK